jgi:ATP-binding cassette subfamily E protein 1
MISSWLLIWLTSKYLSKERVVVFEGVPSVKSVANAPESLVSGMNKFLKMLEITFRRDPINFRPRINKLDSQKDQEQKAAGCYFLMDDSKKKEGKNKKKKEKGEDSENEEDSD